MLRSLWGGWLKVERRVCIGRDRASRAHRLHLAQGAVHKRKRSGRPASTPMSPLIGQSAQHPPRLRRRGAGGKAQAGRRSGRRCDCAKAGFAVSWCIRHAPTCLLGAKGSCEAAAAAQIQAADIHRTCQRAMRACELRLGQCSAGTVRCGWVTLVAEPSSRAGATWGARGGHRQRRRMIGAVQGGSLTGPPGRTNRAAQPRPGTRASAHGDPRGHQPLATAPKFPNPAAEFFCTK
jgi:hypothetical protein